METENQPQDRDGHYPAQLYFTPALRRAIQIGSSRAIEVGLKRQEVNSVTEALSNHLLVRSFLVEQKGALVALENSIDAAETIMEITTTVDNYAYQLEGRFKDMFAVDGGDEIFSKLSGDALFREVIGTPSEGQPVIARRLADVDVAALSPPDELYYQVDDIRGNIQLGLWLPVDRLRQVGMRANLLEALKGALANQVANLDDELLKNLPEARNEGWFL